MGNFKIEEYECVSERLPKFFKKYPDGRVITDLVHNVDKFGTVIFKATLYSCREDQEMDCPLSTGWSFEKEGDGYVNKTSHVENSETSAIGRALANITMHGDKRPSKEEMKKVQKMTKTVTKDKPDEELF